MEAKPVLLRRRNLRVVADPIAPETGALGTTVRPDSFGPFAAQHRLAQDDKKTGTLPIFE